MAILKTLKSLPGRYWLAAGLSFLIGVLWMLQALFSVKKPPSGSPSPLPSSQPHFTLPSISPSPSISSINERGDPSYWQEINRQLEANFPLVNSLPFSNEKFIIRYIGPLKLEITLKFASESAKTEALEWLRNQGMEPTSHEIIFK